MPSARRIVITKREYIARVLFGQAQRGQGRHKKTWTEIPEDGKNWWRDLAHVAIRSGQTWERAQKKKEKEEA